MFACQINTDDPRTSTDAKDGILKFYGSRRVTCILAVVREFEGLEYEPLRRLCERLAPIQSDPYSRTSGTYPVISALEVLHPSQTVRGALNHMKSRVRTDIFKQFQTCLLELIFMADFDGSQEKLQEIKNAIQDWQNEQ